MKGTEARSRTTWGSFVGVGLALVMTVGAAHAGPCVSPPSGMVAWWPLDETTGATSVQDIVGGNHGTPHPGAIGPIGPPTNGPAPGSLSPIAPPATVGGSLYFYAQATPRLVEVPNNPSLNFGAGDFTIDAWVFPVQVGTGFVQPVVDKLQLQSSPAGGIGYRLFILNGQLHFVLLDGSTAVDTPAPISPGQWHHIAVVHKGSPANAVEVYIDGNLANSSTPAIGSTSNQADLLIGGIVSSPGTGGLPPTFGYGEIAVDELEIFSVALAPSDIQSIHSAGSAGKCKCVQAPSGMVAWWPMDEGAGATSLQDIIGGNNATPFNSQVGAPQAPQPVPGVVSGAIDFPKFGNGLSGARVSPSGALATIGAANFTVDAWVNVPTAPANRPHYIVNKFDTAQNKGYALYVISPGVAGNERLEFKWGDGTNVSTVQTISPMTTGQWHHVAVTFTRNATAPTLDIRLYVDGVQAGQQTGNPPGLGSLVNFVFLEIGWQPSTLDEPITTDELEIFNVALPQVDIQSIFNAGSAGKCKCATGGQSVDLTVASAGAVFGVGSGVAATVSSSSPLTVNYSIQGCFGHEMFLLAAVNAPPLFLPPSYLNSAVTWIPLPGSLSAITPGPFPPLPTSNGAHTLFSASLPPGTYDLVLICDLFNNGHLDVTGPPVCLSGAFDYLHLTVQ